MGNEVSAVGKQQAQAVPGTETEGCGPIYRCMDTFPDKPLITTLYPEVSFVWREKKEKRETSQKAILPFSLSGTRFDTLIE